MPDAKPNKYTVPLKVVKNNPSKELVTDNPALSLPYVKYYTSILEEYVALKGKNGTAEDAIKGITEKDYAFPSYLRYKPYQSMNAFPIMQVYHSSKDSNIKSKESTIERVPGEAWKVQHGSSVRNVSDADIVLTYRAIKSRAKFMKEIFKDTSSEFETNSTTILRSLVTDYGRLSSIGSDPKPSSQGIQYILPFIANGNTKELLDGINIVNRNTKIYGSPGQVYTTLIDKSNAGEYDMLTRAEQIHGNDTNDTYKDFITGDHIENITYNEIAHRACAMGLFQILGRYVNILGTTVEDGSGNPSAITMLAGLNRNASDFTKTLDDRIAYEVKLVSKWILSTHPSQRIKRGISQAIHGYRIFNDSTGSITKITTLPMQSDNADIKSTDSVDTNSVFGRIASLIYGTPQNSADIGIWNTYKNELQAALDTMQWDAVNERWYFLVRREQATSSHTIWTAYFDSENVDGYKYNADPQKDKQMMAVHIQDLGIGLSGSSTYEIGDQPLYEITDLNGDTIPNYSLLKILTVVRMYISDEYYNAFTEDDAGTVPAIIDGVDATERLDNITTYFQDLHASAKRHSTSSDYYTKYIRNERYKYMLWAWAMKETDSKQSSLATYKGSDSKNLKDRHVLIRANFSQYFNQYVLQQESKTLVENRYVYVKKAAMKITDTIKNSINISTASDATIASATMSILDNIKDGIRNIEIDENIPLSNTSTFKSYLLIEAMVIAHVTNGLHELIEAYVDKAKDVSAISRNTKSISKTLQFIAGALGKATGIKGLPNPGTYKIDDQSTFNNALKVYIDEFLDVADKNRSFNEDYLSNYGHTISLIYQYIRHISNIYAMKAGDDNLDETFAKDGDTVATLLGSIDEQMEDRLQDNRIKAGLIGARRDEFAVPTPSDIAIIDEPLKRLVPDFVSAALEFDVPYTIIDESPTYSKVIRECNAGVIAITSMFRRIVTTDIMRYKNLVIRNEEDTKNQTATTITKYRVNTGSSNIPIFMDGHEHPIVQNFGGNKPTIEISCITNDVFMLDDITSACQELDIAFRTRSELRNVNPLAASFGKLDSNIQKNSTIYNLTRKNLQRRLSALSKGASSIIGEGSVDAPLLITNNVANMMGVYGCVLKQILVSSIEGFPNTYQLDMTFIGVDINQQFRETPRKKKIEADPLLLSMDLCRHNQFSHVLLGVSAPLVVQVNNMQSCINKMLARLITMNFISRIITGRYPPGFVYRNDVAKDKNTQLIMLAEMMMASFIHDVMNPILSKIDNVSNSDHASEVSNVIQNSYKRMAYDFKNALAKQEPPEGKSGDNPPTEMWTIHRNYKPTEEQKKANEIGNRGKISMIDYYVNYEAPTRDADTLTVNISGKAEEPVQVGFRDDGKGNTVMGHIIYTVINRIIGKTNMTPDAKEDTWESYPSIIAAPLRDGTISITNFAKETGLTELDLVMHIINELIELCGGSVVAGTRDVIRERKMIMQLLGTAHKSETVNIYADYTMAFMMQLTKELKKSAILEATFEGMLNISGLGRYEKYNHKKQLSPAALEKLVSNKKTARRLATQGQKKLVSRTQFPVTAAEGSPKHEAYTRIYHNIADRKLDSIDVTMLSNITKKKEMATIDLNALGKYKHGLQAYFAAETIHTSMRQLYMIKTANSLVEDNIIKVDEFELSAVRDIFSAVAHLGSTANSVTVFSTILEPKYLEHAKTKNNPSGLVVNASKTTKEYQPFYYYMNKLPQDDAIIYRSEVSTRPASVGIKKYVAVEEKSIKDQLIMFADSTVQNAAKNNGEEGQKKLDTKEVYIELGLFKRIEKLSDFTSKLIPYRIMDNITKYVLLPMISKMTAENAKTGAFVSATASGKAFEDMLDKLYKKQTPSEVEGQQGNSIRIFSGKVNASSLSQETIRMFALTMTLNSTQLYDHYNAYADRPLPVFGISATSMRKRDADQRMLAGLQIFTAPDFFLKKDHDYIQLVTDDINSKLDGAKATIEADNMPDNIVSKTSRQAHAETLVTLAERTSQISTDKMIDFETQMDSIIGRITGGYNPATQKEELKGFLGARYSASTSVLKTIQTVTSKLKGKGSRSQRIVAAINAFSSSSENVKVQEFDKEYRLTYDLKRQLTKSYDLDQLTDTVNRLDEARRRLASGDRNISSHEMSLLKSLVNPGRGAYVTATTDIMKQKLQRLTVNARRGVPVSTIGMAFPTFKLYIIEEDAKEFLFFNDFYDYAAVKSIRIHKTRKGATEVAYIELSNIYGRLTNIIAGKRSTSENPFYLRPNEEEDVQSMMLRPGALIQVRLGYSANLDASNIAFSGRIQEVQGTNQIIIVAQSHGIELTRVIGTGSGQDFGGILNRIKLGDRTSGITDTCSALGLVASLLDEAKVPLRGIGSHSPFLGTSRIRNVSNSSISGIETTEIPTVGWTGTLMRHITTKVKHGVLGLSADVKLIDNRLTNVNLSGVDSNNFFTTLVGRSRWLVLNETIWDALQDYTLQLGNKICTMRSFDEDNTLVIDNDDGIYQRSMENYVESAEIFPIITDFEIAERSARAALSQLAKILRKDNDDTIETIVIGMLRTSLRSFISPTSGYTEKEKERTAILNLAEEIVKDLKNNGDISLGIYVSFATKYDNASQEAIDKLNALITNIKGNKTGELRAKFDLDSIFAKDVLQQFPSDQQSTALVRLYVATSASMHICKYMKHHIASTNKSFRAVSEVHIKTASKDIIKNNIKTVAGYNRVDLSYIDEDVAGTALGLIGMDQLGQLVGLGKSITLDNIDKPSVRYNIFTSLSQTIEYDKVNTYSTFQKNASIRGSIIVDNPRIISNSILANLVRDYYDGEIIILMDPTIEPYDTIFIHDDVNDMWGMIQVKEVTHSFSAETGAVTIVKPDMYVRNNIDSSRQTYSTFGWKALGRMAIASSSLLMTVAAWGVGRLVLGGVGSIITRFAKKGTAWAGTKANEKALTLIGKKLLDGKKIGWTARRQLRKVLRKGKMKDIATKLGLKDVRTDSDVIRVFLTDIKKTVSNTTTEGKILRKSIDSVLVVPKGQTVIPMLNKKGTIVEAGLDDVYENLFTKVVTNMKDSGLTGTTGETSMSKVIKLFNDGMANGTHKVTSNILLRLSVQGIRDLFPGPIAGMARIINIFSVQSITTLVAAGLSVRVGRQILPNLDTFVANMGEYLNQRPITIAGLIQKGEPLVANMDGMSRAEFGSFTNWMGYKVGETLNPLYELAGNVEELLYKTNNFSADIPFSELLE